MRDGTRERKKEKIKYCDTERGIQRYKEREK